jgi:hypothetical protein
MRTAQLARVLVGLAATTLVAACVTAVGGTTPDPNASSLETAPTVTSGPASTDGCGMMDVQGTHAPYTIPKLVAQGKVLVIGKVEAIAPAIFNTADGRRPPGFGTVAGDQANPYVSIITPVVVLVERDINSKAPLGALRLYVRGGTVGCFTEIVSFAPDLQVKSRYVFVLQDGTESDGSRQTDLREIRFAYPIDSANIVQTEQGPVSVDDLVNQVESVTPAPAAP